MDRLIKFLSKTAPFQGDLDYQPDSGFDGDHLLLLWVSEVV